MYEYAIAKNVLTRLLSREDFLSILSSRNIENAIKTIADKPIGARLYQVIRSKTYSITDLELEIDQFNLERLSIFKQTCRKDKIYTIDSIEKLFDLINIAYIVLNLINGGKPSIIYPVGNAANIDLSGVSSLEEFKNILGKNLGKLLELVIMDGFRDYNLLFSAINKLRDHLLLPMRMRRVYGFIRDSNLVKTCLLMKEEPVKLPHLLTMSLEDFTNLCRSKDPDQLMRMLREINPLYKGFSELLSEIYNVSKNMGIIDFAILLYASYISEDLIYSYEEVIARAYILMITEALMLKTALTNLWFNTNIEYLKNIVNKWWII